MVDNVYKNAFKEVYYILQNTDEELLNKIPTKFMDFIKNNMNENYEISISTDIEIDKQNLLKETESILALIYRSYWAIDTEKVEFANKDKIELIELEQKKKEQFKDINEIFEERRNLNNVTLDNSLAVIPKENFFKRFFNKLMSFFKK